MSDDPYSPPGFVAGSQETLEQFRKDARGWLARLAAVTAVCGLLATFFSLATDGIEAFYVPLSYSQIQYVAMPLLVGLTFFGAVGSRLSLLRTLTLCVSLIIVEVLPGPLHGRFCAVLPALVYRCCWSRASGGSQSVGAGLLCF